MQFYKFTLTGVFKGTQFRAYVCRTANSHNLVGRMSYSNSGIEIIINDKDFVNKLLDLPIGAKIIDCNIEKLNKSFPYQSFGIDQSMNKQESNPDSIKNSFIDNIVTALICNNQTVVKTKSNNFHLSIPKFAKVNSTLIAPDLQNAEKIFHISDKESEFLSTHNVLLRKLTSDFDHISELNHVSVTIPTNNNSYELLIKLNQLIAIRNSTKNADFTTNSILFPNHPKDTVKVIQDHPLYISKNQYSIPFKINNIILALGAEMSSVASFSKNNFCSVSKNFGNAQNTSVTNNLINWANISIKDNLPERIVCDLHPEYSSTIIAKKITEDFDIPLFQVQHHKAHVASVAAEHNLKSYIGISLDGLGFGEDDAIWGGEIFHVEDNKSFSRIGHLQYQPQVGGDSATQNPSKMLFGILSSFLTSDEIDQLNIYDPKEISMYTKMLKENFNVPKTSSTGRILDAASNFLAICNKRTYDGRPAMLLEAKATTPLNIDPIIESKQNKKILNTSELFRFLLNNKTKSVGELAATVQMYIAKGTLEIAKQKSEETGLPIVASGGVLYNRMITSHFLKNNVKINKLVPPGDQGICVGQTLIADNM